MYMRSSENVSEVCTNVVFVPSFLRIIISQVRARIGRSREVTRRLIRRKHALTGSLSVGFDISSKTDLSKGTQDDKTKGKFQGTTLYANASVYDGRVGGSSVGHVWRTVHIWMHVTSTYRSPSQHRPEMYVTKQVYVMPVWFESHGLHIAKFRAVCSSADALSLSLYCLYYPASKEQEKFVSAVFLRSVKFSQKINLRPMLFLEIVRFRVNRVRRNSMRRKASAGGSVGT